MFFPYLDDNPRSRFPIVTVSVMILNVIFYLWMLSGGPQAYREAILNFGYIAGGGIFRMLSSMFLHAGFLHLLFNMWFLWIFADNVECRFGHLHFLLFYITCGLASIWIHSLFITGELSKMPLVGASGAVT